MLLLSLQNTDMISDYISLLDKLVQKRYLEKLLIEGVTCQIPINAIGRFMIMKATVNPSQKSPDEAHTAWIIPSEVKVKHCDCKAG